MAARKKIEANLSEGAPIASFEKSMARLTEIVHELESGELSLEDSLKRFEEGVGLARASQAELDAAEARVEELLGIDDSGAPILEEFEVP